MRLATTGGWVAGPRLARPLACEGVTRRAPAAGTPPWWPSCLAATDILILIDRAGRPALPACRRRQAGAHVGYRQLEAVCQGAAAAESGLPQHRVGALGRHWPGRAPLPAAGHRCAAPPPHAPRHILPVALPAPSPTRPSVTTTPCRPCQDASACTSSCRAGEAPLVLGLDPATGGMERYIGLEGKIDPGQKKVPKVYHLAVHPTRSV